MPRKLNIQTYNFKSVVKLLLLVWARHANLMNVEFEESGKSMGTATKIVDDLKQQSAHMNS